MAPAAPAPSQFESGSSRPRQVAPKRLNLKNAGVQPHLRLPLGRQTNNSPAKRGFEQRPIDRAVAHQPMCRPPLHEKSAPVVKPASSLASQATMEPISPGSPRRLTGMVATIFSSTSGRMALTMSVPM